MNRWEFSVEQDGMVVASGEAPSEAEAKMEAGHYALMYSQDGLVKVSIKEVRGTPTLPRGGKAQDEENLGIPADAPVPPHIYPTYGGITRTPIEEFVDERIKAAETKIVEEIIEDYGAAMRADFEGSPSRTYNGILRMEESKHGVEAGGSAGEDRRTVEAVSKGDDGVESGSVGVGEQKGVDR
jgi:hypothetical protein